MPGSLRLVREAPVAFGKPRQFLELLVRQGSFARPTGSRDQPRAGAHLRCDVADRDGSLQLFEIGRDDGFCIAAFEDDGGIDRQPLVAGSEIRRVEKQLPRLRRATARRVRVPHPDQLAGLARDQAAAQGGVAVSQCLDRLAEDPVGLAVQARRI